MYPQPVRRPTSGPKFLVPDERNVGGRSQITQLMYNHYNACENIKPITKLPNPRPQSAKSWNRSKLNPEGDPFYNDFDPEIHPSVMRPPAKERSSILACGMKVNGAFCNIGAYPGKNNFKWASGVNWEHNRNLRSQYRKIMEMHMELNRTELKKKVHSPFVFPVKRLAATKVRPPLSNVAHAPSIKYVYPLVEYPEQDGTIAGSYIDQSAHLAQHAKSSRSQQVVAKRSQRADLEAGSDITNYMRLKHEPETSPQKDSQSQLRKSTKSKKKQKSAKRSKPLAAGRLPHQQGSGEDAGVNGRYGGQNINIIEEKDEKEEDDPTYTAGQVAEGQSWSRKTGDLHLGTSSSNQGLQISHQAPLHQSGSSDNKAHSQLQGSGMVSAQQTKEEVVQKVVSVTTHSKQEFTKPQDKASLSSARAQDQPRGLAIEEISEKRSEFSKNQGGSKVSGLQNTQSENNMLSKLENKTKPEPQPAATKASAVQELSSKAPVRSNGTDRQQSNEDGDEDVAYLGGEEEAYEIDPEVMKIMEAAAPVLQSDSPEDQQEFLEYLYFDCFQKFQISSQEQFQALFEATLKKNQHIDEEIIVNIFQQLAKQSEEDGTFEEEEQAQLVA